MKNNVLKIVILSGGDSPEREVSLDSGRTVFNALSSNGVNCELIELSKNRVPESIDSGCDLIFSMIHGEFGEDGRLALNLAEKGISFVGSDYSSSVLAFDKMASKAIAQRCGIPVVQDVVKELSAGDSLEAIDVGASKLVCKPRKQGSSVGIFIATKTDILRADQLREGESYLIEAFIEGIDLTVGVLHGEALGVVGIRPIEGFYDYKNKYTPGNTEYDVPANIADEKVKLIQEWAELIFSACGCSDFARVDFRMKPTGEIYFLEINTIPGMTSTSLYPKSALLCGYDFDNLIQQMIAPSVARFTQKYASA